jgi:hypothetical protein
MQYLLRKQIILLFILLSSSFAAYSQSDEVYRPYNDEKPLYLGLNFGLVNGYMNFERGSNFLLAPNGQANYIAPIFKSLFVMGLSETLRLNSHFLLRANQNILITGSKDIFKFKTPNVPGISTMNATSAILNLPIVLKLESDRYNFFKKPDFMRHYVFAGLKLDLDVSPTREFKGTDATGYKIPYNNLINRVDYGYEFGLGLSFYFPYATVSPEIKFSYGLRDMRDSNILLKSIDKLTSNFVYFTIHVEGESFFWKN